MTVPASIERNDYTGNGSTETYDYRFRIKSQTHLRVTVADADGVETTLSVVTDYTVTNVGVKTGGNIVLTDNGQEWIDDNGYLKTGYNLSIRHYVPLSQSVDIRNQGTFYPEVHEDAFDYVMWAIKQQQDELNRCIKVGETETNAPTATEILDAAEGAETAKTEAEAARDAALNYATAFTTTSLSSVSITVAQKTFTVASGKQFVFGMPIIAMDSASVSNYMYGTVNSYSGTTLVIDVIFTGGSGTISSWNIFMTGFSGPKGDTGATGPAGTGAGDVLGPATNTDNYVPQWNGDNTKTLKNGYPVGNGANSIPKTDGSSKLAASIIPAIDLTSMVTGVLPSANGGIDSTEWTDYSDTSSITGFSSYANKVIRYKKIGRLVFVVFHINGISNSSTKSFTLPASLNTSGSSDFINLTYAYEQNGAGFRNFARGYINSDTLEIYADQFGTGWATSGNVALRGSFFYEANS